MNISIFRKALLCASFIIFSIAGYATPLTWTVDATRGPTLGPVGGLSSALVAWKHAQRTSTTAKKALEFCVL